MSTAALRFEGVGFAYGQRRVLEGVDVWVSEGSVTAILGPNGVGKTTLLFLALGWLRPSEGRVLIDGRPLRSYSRRQMGQMMGLVPQTEHIPFEYSVVEYVLLGRAPHLEPLETPGADDVDRALAALSRVGLQGFEDRPITSLSGGERELALVARALAQEPRLLLLDEPTSHLDLKNKRRMVEVIGDLAASGVTILFTTHEPDLAAALATDLVLLRGGSVLRAGPVAETLTGDNLSATYGINVRVVEADGRRAILWL
jgi:iron complex transport system ATP-binding protein